MSSPATDVPIEQRSYQTVPALSTVTSDYVIPAGSTLMLESLGGNSPTTPQLSVASIIWDPNNNTGSGPQVIFATFSVGFQFSKLSFTGDGVTVMRIQLVNNQVVDVNMGCYYAGMLSTPGS